MIENDDPSARWRAIERQMADDPRWQSGVRLLGLVVHHVVEQYPPHELKNFADSATKFFFQCVADEAARLGVTLSEDQADDIGSALFASALDFAETLPHSETRLFS